MQKKTTNEHQWTRITHESSKIGQQEFWPLFGERVRGRRANRESPS
jgi:hypothetical protein